MCLDRRGDDKKKTKKDQLCMFITGEIVFILQSVAKCFIALEDLVQNKYVIQIFIYHEIWPKGLTLNFLSIIVLRH